MTKGNKTTFKDMKYNQYSYKTIKRLFEEGQKLAEIYHTEEDMVHATNYNISEYMFVAMGFCNPDFVLGGVQEFYRIGEPVHDGYGCYKPSWNFAEDRPEGGVSVVTTAWLHSFKSIFFNTTDENIRSRGVYKIKGFVVPGSGGDDEILVCPLDWAERTKIRTREGLARAVKKCGM